ncbi:ABC transporter ATP-binding protein [Polycladidibacter stylochi]|uniref:ABC transporter ATP-binding protein n=1 Tax=Polycladidibacter stylochi TaxID=1807766 RepID=UPI0009E7D945|nr:ATP-binding cassette domain-containing protein [Pseudovibrio stylochi]
MALLHAKPPQLAIEGLKVQAAKGRTLLDVAQLTVRAGQSIAISGPSGAGKSTLLMALAGLTKHTSGTVQWGASDIIACSEREKARLRRTLMGFVFQDYLLFEELSALDNAAIDACYAPKARRAEIYERAAHLLELLGLKDTMRRSVASFSGGERQRVSVARALSHDPAVLLADEPTASLDRTTADRLIEDLLSLTECQGKTLLVVSHDSQLIRLLQRRLHVEEGRIVQDNLHDAASLANYRPADAQAVINESEGLGL